MSETEKVLTPAYASFATVVTTLDNLKADGVTPKFDRSLLTQMSGSSQSQILSTFRYLQFIDDEGNTQPILGQIAYADQDERRVLWAKVLRNAYPYLFDSSDGFDLARCAPSTFRDKFASQSIKGETLTKAIRFFLFAADAAQIEVSPYVKKNFQGRGRTTSPTKSKTTTRKAKAQTTSTSNNGSTPATKSVSKPASSSAPTHTPQQTQLLAASGYEILQALLHKLPSDFQWTMEERNRWIAAHTAVLDLHVQIVREDEYEDDYEDQ